jgi:hypothetical protein
MGSSQPVIVVSSSHHRSDNKTQKDDEEEVSSLQKSLEMINDGSKKSPELAELKNLLDCLYLSSKKLLERDKFDSSSYQKAKICQKFWNKRYGMRIT